MAQREPIWQEWVITSALVLLSAGAVWAVFGDDLALLVAPETVKETHRSAQGATKPSSKGP